MRFAALTVLSAAMLAGLLSFAPSTASAQTCVAPTVFTNGVVNVGDTYATLQGNVNSLGGTVAFWFEYGTGYALGSRTPEQTINVPAGVTTPVTMVASGLTPGITYTVQAVARTPCGTTGRGSFVTFVTSGYGGGYNPYNPYGNNCQYVNGQWYPYGCNTSGNQYPYGGQQSPPTVVTSPATGIGTNEATLSGTVTPNGSIADAWFEYGTTEALGLTLPSLSVGDGFGSAPRTTTIQTLRPGTAYYFRLVARNQSGTNRGLVQNFRTAGVYAPPANPPQNPPQNPPAGSASVTLDASTENANAAPGEEIVYQAHYRNAGSGTAENAALTVILPVDTELVATVPAPSSQAGQSLAMTIGSIPPGGAGSAIVRAQVKPTARADAGLSLTAILDYADASGSHSVNASANGEVGGAGSPSVAAVSSFFGDIPGYAWFFAFLLLIVLIVVYAIFRMRTANGHEAHGAAHH